MISRSMKHAQNLDSVENRTVVNGIIDMNVPPRIAETTGFHAFTEFGTSRKRFEQRVSASQC
jgi:hypothetical protein